MVISCTYINKQQRIQKGQSQIDNPEKQDEEKQSKNTTQYPWDTTIHKQTQIS